MEDKRSSWDVAGHSQDSNKHCDNMLYTQIIPNTDREANHQTNSLWRSQCTDVKHESSDTETNHPTNSLWRSQCTDFKYESGDRDANHQTNSLWRRQCVHHKLEANNEFGVETSPLCDGVNTITTPWSMNENVQDLEFSAIKSQNSSILKRKHFPVQTNSQYFHNYNTAVDSIDKKSYVTLSSCFNNIPVPVETNSQYFQNYNTAVDLTNSKSSVTLSSGFNDISVPFEINSQYFQNYNTPVDFTDSKSSATLSSCDNTYDMRCTDNQSSIKKKCLTENNKLSESDIGCSVEQISNISSTITTFQHKHSVVSNSKIFSQNVQYYQPVSWNNSEVFQQSFINQTKQIKNLDKDRNSTMSIMETNFPISDSPLVEVKQEQFCGNYDTGAGMSHNMEAKVRMEAKVKMETKVKMEVKVESEERGIFLFESDALNSISDKYILIEKWQCQMLRGITLPDKVAYVYNPLEYAFEPHYDFISKFCNSEKYILFLGMNPGPWGMSQNGVPFGESGIVRNWFGIEGSVLKPRKEHPKRLILGLNSTRSEVSGCRFWNLFKEICKTPEHFFKTSFVYNMCPLAFMTETAKNVTPPQLTSATLHQVNDICDEALLRVVSLLNIKVIVGIGKYAYTRAQKVMTSANVTSVLVDQIMHPSPINPAANKGWSKIVLQQLQEKGLLDIIKHN